MEGDTELFGHSTIKGQVDANSARSSRSPARNLNRAVASGGRLTASAVATNAVTSATASASGCPCEPLPSGLLPPAELPLAFLEQRRWWRVALPRRLTTHLPLLQPGGLLQTCGHAVHRQCFDKYLTMVSKLLLWRTLFRMNVHNEEIRRSIST
ncbi:unnamed protein product [Protopolystoma xenopodis]|uniref:Uncharacterized protein n=1 Tax=Protopolystoma xenopodis TaxID=117903 RepID=A0A448WT18_9PLAT|nr:unnamed protein product [Protopolystoma xenopodis]